MADWAALATRIAEPSDSCAIGVPLLIIALSTPASLTAEPSRSWVCPENCFSANIRPTAVHPSASSRWDKATCFFNIVAALICPSDCMNSSCAVSVIPARHMRWAAATTVCPAVS